MTSKNPSITSRRNRTKRAITIIIVIVLALAMALSILGTFAASAASTTDFSSISQNSPILGKQIVGDSKGVSTINFNYVIKLKTNDSQILKPFVSSAESIFAFSSSPAFARVYSFRSPAPLGVLRQALTGQYEYLELDQSVTVKAQTTLVANALNPVFTNDPGFTGDPANIDRQWALPKVGFTNAWRSSTGSTDVVVGVIDTGIDETHEDFTNTRFAEGIDLLTGQTIRVGTNADDNGHGTLVSGVIGATPNNGIGVAGAAWKVTLLPVKALDSKGSGTSSAVSQAIVWAADHGAAILNMSLGGLGFGHDTTLANAVSYAYRKNVLLVSAAGNDAAITGGDLDVNPVFPICDDNGENMILGVTASDQNDIKPDFANFGKVCVDVSAPGKRILSTINHDPVTGSFAPDSYAYASGTSLAVPYVVAQAVLLKSVYPLATNKQLRDRIISSAVNIDANNLSQCASGSCRGLIGSGRIDVSASIATPIVAYSIKDGDVVKMRDTGVFYYISGGKRQPISDFVFNQRFKNAPIIDAYQSDVSQYPIGQFAEPLDETLVMMPNDPTVYSMSKGLRLPVTYQVFLLRHYSFNKTNVLSFEEMSSWLIGSFLAPPDGTLLRTPGNQTVHWVVGGVLHPINYNFYIERGLNIFPVVYVSDNDLKGFSKGEAYIR